MKTFPIKSIFFSCSVLIILFTSNFSGLSQVAPSWIWAKEEVGNSNDISYGLDIDSQGNILMTGYSESTLTLDTIGLNATSTGKPDFFLAKFNPNGNILWAKQCDGVGEDQAYDVVCDEDDNIIITGVIGMFSSNSLTIDSLTLSNVGSGDFFLVKFDENGNLLWGIREGGYAREWGRSIDVDLAGNIYVCGNFIGGDSNIGGTTISNNGDYGFFISKYKSSGALLWYKIGNTPDKELMRNIVVFPETGNLYAFGDFEDDHLTLDSVTIYNHYEGNLDNFLFKLNTNGDVLWGRCIGGNQIEKGNFCTVDSREDVFVTGTYASSECYIGSDTLFNPTVYNSDTYIAMYSYLGNYEWSHSISGDDSEIAYSITSDTSDFIFVTGYFNSSSLNIGGQTFINNGDYDIFVAKYDYQSGFHWAITAGGTGTDKANVITINQNRELFITGTYTSPTLQFDSSTLYHTSGEDIFLAKLKDYCEMPDVFIGNDTILYAQDELIIDIPGYQNYFWGNGYSGQSITVQGSDYNTGYTPLTITVVDSSGCVSEDEILITICNYPQNFLGSDTTILDNQQIALNANFGYDSFVWNTGEIGSSIIVNGSIIGTGDYYYWVEASDQYGCLGLDTILITIIEENSIEEIGDMGYKIYPVPTSNVVNIVNNNSEIITAITIYKTNLQKIRGWSINNTDSDLVVDVSELSSGVYFMRIESSNTSRLVKIVIDN